MKKILTVIALAVIGMLLGAGATPADAHQPEAEADCEGLTIRLRYYEAPNSEDSVNNDLIYTVDGVTNTVPFATELDLFVPWPGGAQSHTWSVEVDANIVKGHPTQYDWSDSGTVEGCEVPPTTTEPPPVTTNPPAPTTTLPNESPTPTPPVTGPATTPTTTPSPDYCIVTDRTTGITHLYPIGKYEVYQGAPGTTKWNVMPCGPTRTAATTTVAPAAAVTGQLPTTGGTTWQTLAIAGGLLLAGGPTVALARRRR